MVSLNALANTRFTSFSGVVFCTAAIHMHLLIKKMNTIQGNSHIC